MSPATDPLLAEIRSGLKSYFEDHAPQRERWKARASYYHSQIEALLASLIPVGSVAVEVGCGTGDLLNALRPSPGLGLDFSPAMIARARLKHPELRFEVDDLEELRTAQTFDYVILSDVIGCMADLWTAFRHLRSMCHPGTRVVITYYNYLWEPFLRLAETLGLKAVQPLQSWLTLRDIENLLRLNGLRVVRSGYHVLIPVWIPGLSYIANRFLARLPMLRRLCLVEYIVARAEPLTAPTASLRSTKPHSISVVVPALDEEGNIRPLAERLPLMGRSTEIVFVEGRSSDRTMETIAEVARSLRPGFSSKIVDQGGRFGKADAVRKGFAAATGEVLIILDSDLSVAPEDLPKFYAALAAGRGELINGSRLNYPMERQAMRYFNIVGNYFFGAALSWLMDQNIRDSLCGSKALLRSDYDRIAAQRHYFGDFDPFGDFDLLFGAARLGMEIVEMPVRYRSRTYGETKISRFRHGLLLLGMCWFALRKLKFC